MTGQPLPPDGWYLDERNPRIERWFYRGRWTQTTRPAESGARSLGADGPSSLPAATASWRGKLPTGQAWAIIVAVIVGVALLSQRSRLETSRPGSLHYDGTAAAVNVSVTKTGGTSTYSSLPNGGSMSIPAGQTVYVQVSNASPDNTGSVICTLVDGQGRTVASNTANGEFAVASCSGRI